MKKILFPLVYFICICAIITPMQAQKYGHVNLGNLLAEMPEVDAGSKQLEAYQTQLVEALQVKVTDWEKRYKALESQVTQLPPNEVREKEEILVTEQRGLLEQEQAITVEVNKKRTAIMGPIINKVQVAIETIGAEKGYTMIFDTSIPNVVLYVSETEDLIPLVKAKLGIE